MAVRSSVSYFNLSQESKSQLDVRIFLRVGHDTLMERRSGRDYYIAGKVTGCTPQSELTFALFAHFHPTRTIHYLRIREN